MIRNFFGPPRLTRGTAKSIADRIAEKYCDKTDEWLLIKMEYILSNVFDADYPDYKVTSEESRAIAMHVAHLRNEYPLELQERRELQKHLSDYISRGMLISDRRTQKMPAYFPDKTYLEIFKEGPPQDTKATIDYKRRFR